MRSGDRQTDRGATRPTAHQAARRRAIPAETPPPARTGRPLRLLITAGPTREYLDPVRYLSNESSGRMGFAVAEAAQQRGHAVTLIYGPVALPTPLGVAAVPVISSAEMLTACRRAWPRQDALIMAAAVSDYRPQSSAPRKLKKSAQALTLVLEPTEDILATLSRARRARQRVIGFALEDHRGRENAAGKLQRKGLDAIVLNSPAALGARRSRVEVLTAGGSWQTWPEADKHAQAQRLILLLESLFTAPERPTRARPRRRTPEHSSGRRKRSPEPRPARR